MDSQSVERLSPCDGQVSLSHPAGRTVQHGQRLQADLVMSGPDGSSTHQFDATTLAAHDARGVVRETLAGYSEAVVEVAALLASELVTNAVQHAGSQPSMRIEANGGGFRVAVHDGSHQLPRMAPPTENADSGWGLQLVEALSTEWGVTPTSDGKTIWFEFLEPAAYTADAGPFTSLGE